MFYINVSPVAFTIGPVSVAWYGIMVALAVMTVVTWALVMTRREPGIKSEVVINAALVGIPSGVVFSRLFHVADHWSYFSQHLNEIIGGSGLAIYGAVLGATFGIFVYSRFRKMQFGRLADIVAPGIILAQAVGRVGCTFNGCCTGDKSDAFCAVVYTSPQTNAPINTAVLPTQVFEIIFNLVLFGGLLLLRKRLRPDGSLFLVYLALYSAWRFGIDFVREGVPFFLGLHEAQVIAIVVFGIAAVLTIKRTRWVGKGEEIEPEE
jgi:phosphatidylglycerol:prolipoprotein diacylglycerol transferase